MLGVCCPPPIKHYNPQYSLSLSYRMFSAALSIPSQKPLFKKSFLMRPLLISWVTYIKIGSYNEHINEDMRYLSFWVSDTSLNIHNIFQFPIIFLKFSYVYISLSLNKILLCIYLYCICIICSSVDGHVGWFHFLAILKRASKNHGWASISVVGCRTFLLLNLRDKYCFIQYSISVKGHQNCNNSYEIKHDLAMTF